MKIEQIDHIHIAVRDLNKATSLFESILDVRFSREFVSEELEIKSRIAAIGSVGIELIQPTSPTSEIAKFLERRGEGLHAISLKVTDIDEAISQMKAKGIRLTTRIELPMLREAEFHPKDIHGVQIELCQYEMEHPAAFRLFEQTVR